MINLKIETNYKQFRLNKLNDPDFSHLKLLLYWPLFGIMFLLLERFLPLNYHNISCSFDNYIPLCEYFVIPYYFWFVFLIGMLAYSLFFSIETFKKYMWYIIITYSFTILIYIVYPTAQELRPTNFERNNIFTHILTKLYNFDTNTNVCPSLHVIGSLAVFFSAWHDKRLSGALSRLIFFIITVLISVSTVFLKQHSVIDIITAVLLCLICYPFVFSEKFAVVNKRNMNPQKKCSEMS